MAGISDISRYKLDSELNIGIVIAADQSSQGSCSAIRSFYFHRDQIIDITDKEVLFQRRVIFFIVTSSPTYRGGSLLTYS